MKPERKMIELKVSYDGKVSAEEIEPCATQPLYYIRGNEHGMLYHCPEDKKDYYLQRILNFMKKKSRQRVQRSKSKER